MRALLNMKQNQTSLRLYYIFTMLTILTTPQCYFFYFISMYKYMYSVYKNVYMSMVPILLSENIYLYIYAVYKCILCCEQLLYMRALSFIFIMCRTRSLRERKGEWKCPRVQLKLLPKVKDPMSLKGWMTKRNSKNYMYTRACITKLIY